MRWLVLLLIGCPKSSPAPAAATAPEPVATEVVVEGDAPVPYTAEQIAGSWRPGLVVVWQITMGDNVSFSRWEVTAATSEEATIAYYDSDATHAALGAGDEGTSTYTSLRDHARFDAAVTTVEEVDFTSPMGDHRAYLYTVKGTEEDPDAIRKYWFGLDTPGAPLLHTVESGGQLQMEMKMVRREVSQ